MKLVRVQLRIASARPPQTPKPDDGAAASVRTLSELVESLGKGGAVLAVAGYISLRAHLNFLGISAMAPLGVQHYLAATWSFALVTALNCCVLITAAGVSLLLGSIGVWAIRRVGLALRGWASRKWQNQSITGTMGRLPDSLRTLGEQFRQTAAKVAVAMKDLQSSRSMMISAGILCLDLAMLSWYNRLTTDRYDIIVGRLIPARVNAPGSLQFFRILLAVGFFGYLFGRARETERAATSADRVLWLAHRAVWIVLVALIPAVYGMFVQSTLYPTAQATFEHGEPVCGLLILQTSESLTFWRAVRGSGRTEIIPVSRIQALHVGGAVDLRVLANAAADQPVRARSDGGDSGTNDAGREPDVADQPICSF